MEANWGDKINQINNPAVSISAAHSCTGSIGMQEL
jgi:hypothetical protein